MKTETILNFISNNKRELMFSVLFALLFTCCFILGRATDIHGTIFVKYHIFRYISLFVFISTIMFIAFKYLINYILEHLKSYNIFSPIENIFFQNNNKCFIAVFLFIAITHIPAFLAYFPGLFTYDTYYQADFFLNHNFVEKDPVIHSFLVYLTLLFSQKFNTDIWGVFIYTLFQSGIIFLIWAYSIKIMSKYNTPFLIKLFALLFFSFYPTHQVFPLIATKDALFCNFVLLFVVLITDLLIEKEKFIKSNKKYLLLMASIILMFLFRHNGTIVFLILPFILIYLYKNMKTNLFKLISLFLIPLLIYVGFSITKTQFNIKQVSANSLNIPMQQMGRVRLFNDNILTEEDKETFKIFVIEEEIMEYYPYLSDYLLVDEAMSYKYIENAMKQNPKLFWDLYFKWAKEYPKEYIDAYLNMNYGYWYLLAKYRIVDLHYYLYTENRWDDFFGTKISMHSLNKPLQKFYNNLFLEKSFEKNPITFAMFAIGINTWFIIFCLFILAYKRRYDLILALSIVIALFIIAQFGAIVLLRYIYTDFLIVPLLIAFCFADKEKGIWSELTDKKAS